MSYQKVVCTTVTTPLQKEFLLKERQRRSAIEKRRVTAAEVLRDAINALRQEPDTAELKLEKYTERLPVFYLPEEDEQFLRERSVVRDVTISQCVRDALAALMRKQERSATIEVK